MERLVKERMVFDHVQVQTRKKKEALRLISYLCAKESGIYAGKLLEAFEKREYLDSTGCGEGIAVPHARVSGVKEPLVVVVRFEWKVEWDSLDGKPVDLVFAIITPQEDEDNRYLTVLSLLFRRLMDERFVDNLRKCSDKDQLYQYIIRETV